MVHANVSAPVSAAHKVSQDVRVERPVNIQRSLNSKEPCHESVGSSRAEVAIQRRWWQGLSLDQQEAHLERIDPAKYGWPLVPPMPSGQWNKEQARIRRARERWDVEIAALRRPCHCHRCLAKGRRRQPRFPDYYVRNKLSYECWLECQVIDEELREEIEIRQNNREKIGSVFFQHIHFRRTM